MPKWKYNENKIMLEISQYLEATYGAHYAGNGDIQTVDFWASLGSLESTCRDNAIKYLARYGKKGGSEAKRKDLLKTIHYIILMMYSQDLENEQLNEKEVLDDDDTHS